MELVGLSYQEEKILMLNSTDMFVDKTGNMGEVASLLNGFQEIPGER